jgi:two-component system CAI-1 autoinducer sensor kinase/phosphatase CqsS
MTQTNSQAKLQTLKSLSALIASETKDPLYGIRSACDIMRDHLDEAMKFVDLISFSSSRGLLFADMILKNINDEEIDKSSFEDLSIKDVVENAIVQYLFNNREEIDLLNINYDDDFVFRGDETLMSFVILNLLKNALASQAKIHIWFNSKERCVYLRDEGDGFSEEKLKDIFNEQKVGFAKPDQRQAKPDQRCASQMQTSIVLGLPFCKRVMNAFGGDISVKSEVGKGAEFCLQF